MSYDRSLVGAWLIVIGIFVASAAHHLYKLWRMHRTWRRFNRDERRVSFSEQRKGWP